MDKLKRQINKLIAKLITPMQSTVILFLNLTKLRKLERTKAKNWVATGCPTPVPHLIKQLTIIDNKIKYDYSIFVETGTYLGEMVEAMRTHFHKVYSIELGEKLYLNAINRFRGDTKVQIHLGDSGKVLPILLKEITEPAIFWLDGHYSYGITAKGEKDCPVFEELDAILKNKLPHVILIDDARCFNGTNDYPSIEQLHQFIKTQNPDYKLEVKYDIIRFSI